MNYLVKIDIFEGPFDLLFHLIEKEEVDIHDIPIAKITDQYLSYIKQLKTLDLEVASEFLVMAATLLEIKSKMLLPQKKKGSDDVKAEDIDPRFELVERLLEYKMFKEIAEILKEKEKHRKKLFPSNNKQMQHIYKQTNHPLKNVSISTLIDIFNTLQEKTKHKQDNIKLVKKEKITVSKQIEHIIKKLTLRKILNFNELFVKKPTKLEKIVTFLAILELIKKEKIAVYQKKTCGKIKILLKTPYSKREVTYGSR